MKISDAKADPKPLDVPFGKATLHIEYLPLSYTVREMESVRESKDVRTLIDTMQRVIHSWDLEDEQGSVDPSDDERMLDVPSHIFTEILKAVTEDQKPSGEA